jgi:hypothetical protein
VRPSFTSASAAGENERWSNDRSPEVPTALMVTDAEQDGNLSGRR